MPLALPLRGLLPPRPQPDQPEASLELRDNHKSIGGRAVEMGLIKQKDMDAIGVIMDGGGKAGLKMAQDQIDKWKQMILEKLGEGA